MSRSFPLDCLALAAIAVTSACSSSTTPTTHPDAATDVAQDAVIVTDASQPQTDVSVPTDTVTVVDAATDSSVPTDAALDASACTTTTALIATSNYAMGGWAQAPVAMPSSLTSSTANTNDEDHIPVQSNCLVFDLERSNDYIDTLQDPGLPTVVHHIPLRPEGVDGGSGYYANPSDAYVISAHKVYVAQASLPSVAIVDSTVDGIAAVTGQIDLTPVVIAGATLESGSPSAVNFASYGGFVYLALQNLNSSFAPGGHGTIAVINPTTNALVDTNSTMAGVQPITLTGQNPQAMVTAGVGHVALAEAGVIAFSPPQVLDGLIEAVDLTTNTPVAGQTVTEAQLGGDVSYLVMFDATHGWVAVSVLGLDGGASVTNIVPFNLATSTVGTRIVQTGSVGGMALAPDGTVWVLDRSTGTTGVRTFMQSGTEVTTHAIATGAYPPYGIAFTP